MGVLGNLALNLHLFISEKLLYFMYVMCKYMYIHVMYISPKAL